MTILNKILAELVGRIKPVGSEATGLLGLALKHGQAIAEIIEAHQQEDTGASTLDPYVVQDSGTASEPGLELKNPINANEMDCGFAGDDEGRRAIERACPLRFFDDHKWVTDASLQATRLLVSSRKRDQIILG